MAVIVSSSSGLTVIGNGMHDKSHHYQRRILKYTGPSTYVAGGDLVNPESIGLSKILVVAGLVASSGSAVRLLSWDAANKKIQWWVPNTGSEASGDLSTYTAYLEFIGN